MERAWRGWRVADPGLSRISAEVTRHERSISVEGIVDQDRPTLRPGMYAEVLLVLGDLKDAVVVPGAAVVERPIEERHGPSSVSRVYQAERIGYIEPLGVVV